MSKSKPLKAVIYCRESNSNAVACKRSFASQEARCRDYASQQEYEIMDVFLEKGSCGATHRPAMKAMIDHLHENHADGRIVIIDDISRLARNLGRHTELRNTLTEAGGQLESPSIDLDDSPDNQLIERILISRAEHQHNAE